MFLLDVQLIRAGDIILTSQDEKLSRAIRRATKSNFSHAILHVGHGSYIHSDGDGVHANNIQRLTFSSLDQVKILRLKYPKDEIYIPEICDFARSQIGKQYSVPEAMAAKILRKTSINLRSNRQFCSRLVAQSYSFGGINLVTNPDSCFPCDLENNKYVSEIAGCARPASKEELEFSTSESPLELQKKITNSFYEKARTVSGRDIQNEEQLIYWLMKDQSLDQPFTQYLEESGYLDLWKVDVAKNPWRYDQDKLLQENISPNTVSFEISSAEKDIERFIKMREIYQNSYNSYRLKYFKTQSELYTTLIHLHTRRKDIMQSYLQSDTHPD